MVGRGNTSAFDAEIIKNSIVPRMLVHAEFDAGDVYVWNGMGDIVWDGNTYLGAGQLLSISAVNESSEIRIESMEIQFQGITAAYKTLALSSVALKNKVTVSFALMDTNNAIITNPDIVFIGNMDEVVLKESGETATFSLIVQNELVETQKIKERRYTDEDQKSLYPTDTLLRHAINAEKQTRWGSDPV